MSILYNSAYSNAGERLVAMTRSTGNKIIYSNGYCKCKHKQDTVYFIRKSGCGQDVDWYL